MEKTSIPFISTRSVTQKDGRVETVLDREYFHILPDELKIDGEVKPEVRKRGIYEVVLYSTDLNFKANFGKLDLKESRVDPNTFELNSAFITVGIPDLKGVREQVELNFNGKKSKFNPGVLNKDMVSSGLSVPVKLDSISDAIKLELRVKR